MSKTIDYSFCHEKTSTKLDTKAVSQLLSEYGIVLIPNFLDQKTLAAAQKEVKAALKQFPQTPYAFGESVRLKQKDIDFTLFPTIEKLFFTDALKEIATKYFDSENFSFNPDIFVTHEYKNDGGLARNGYLHFDRLHTFKLFYYLYDTTKESGALTCIPKTHKVGRLLREKAWEESNIYDEVKNRIFIDYPELGYEESDCIPIEAPAGSLMLFGTDVFHRGGKVEQGKERLIIRAHSVAN